MHSFRCRLLVVTLLAGLASVPPVVAQPIPRKTDQQILLEDYASTHQAFAKSMEELAVTCDERGLITAAAVLRDRAARIDHQKLDLDNLPEEIGAGVAEAGDELQTTQQEIETQYAARVFGISQKAMNKGSINLAFHLLREVAFHDPDHENARRMLGYTQHEGKWATAFAASRLRKGMVWHAEFGWLPEAHVSRYEQGMRFYKTRWMTAEAEKEIRRDFDNAAWVVESEHFLVKTNHSLERGVELSQSLEAFHRYFVREFSNFFSTPEQMKALFDGKPSPGNVRKHNVYYYATRGEFVARLKNEPSIQVCNGIYLPGQQIAHFFYDPVHDDGHRETLFHEVTHQILSESTKQTYAIARDANFWIVEGLACYMESFRQKPGGQYTVGFPLHKRIVAAQSHAQEPGEFVPMQAFVALGQNEFQTAGGRGTFMLSDLQRYYAQATALSHFFLHYQNGVYRDPFIKYLSEIYSPKAEIRANVTPLDRLTNVSYATLDRQYLEYMAGLADREPE